MRTTCTSTTKPDDNRWPDTSPSDKPNTKRDGTRVNATPDVPMAVTPLMVVTSMPRMPLSRPGVMELGRALAVVLTRTVALHSTAAQHPAHTTR